MHAAQSRYLWQAQTNRLEENVLLWRAGWSPHTAGEGGEVRHVKRCCYLRLCCITPRARSPGCPGSTRRWFHPPAPPPPFHTDTETQKYKKDWSKHNTHCFPFFTQWRTCHLRGGGHVSLLFADLLGHFDNSLILALLHFNRIAIFLLIQPFHLVSAFLKLEVDSNLLR